MSKSTDSGGWIFLAIVAFLIWYAVRDSDWVAKIYAARHYQLPMSRVDIERQPHDCDFLTAPLGEKHCSYKREYLAEWIALSSDNPPRPIEYGTMQEEPPTRCSQDASDRMHGCHYIGALADGIPATPQWRAHHVEVRWQKGEQ